MQVDKELLEAFQSLFCGREDVWGSVQGLCNKELVTSEHYSKHLAGEISLGIYPLLDSGTCYFAAIDLDVKDFGKARQLRDLLIENNIPTYIAESKSKGYHCYCFAYEVFNASEIRLVLLHALNKLGIKAEVFPKQDIVSDTTPYGNYINLPSFGATRPFLSGDLKEVPLKIALGKIKYVPQEAIERILKTLPKKPPPKTKPKRETPQKHPPCIETILKGVSEPGRDEAAFALARYYLDHSYPPEDVLGLLKLWDERNLPPLDDEKILEAKIKSAGKGYAFGCSSITDNASLVKFCVGIEDCEWLKRKKRPDFKVYFDHRPEIRPALDFVEEKAYISTPMDIDVDITKKVKGETQVVGKKKARRLVTITSDGEIFPTEEDNFMDRGLSMIGTITIPKRRWSLESIRAFTEQTLSKTTFLETFNVIKKRYKYYMDLGPENIYSFASLWVIGSYFFPLFDAYPYTYFGGVREAGKTKMLTITQQMAFNAISSGNISTSSIFRLIEGARATLLIDEAEKLGTTDRGQEFKNILNASYKPGNPVFRAEKTMKEQFIVTGFDAYSPKMLANIAGLEDVLESRVVPFILNRTLDLEIANREIDAKEKLWQDIRNKLYILAMTKWKEVKDTYSQLEPVDGISARNWEIWRPIITLAKVTDPNGKLNDEMIELGRKKSEEKLLEATIESGDSVLVKVLMNIVINEAYYSVREVKSHMIDTYGEQYKWLTNEWVGRAMRRQNFHTMTENHEWKRRMGTGIEYYLTPKMITLAAKRMRIDEKDENGEDNGEGNGEGDKVIDVEV